MNLNAYLTKHDGKPSSHGTELMRLADVAGRSAYYLYLAAMGHKTLSPDTALLLHKASNGDIQPADVSPSFEWHQTAAGEWFYRPTAE